MEINNFILQQGNISDEFIHYDYSCHDGIGFDADHCLLRYNIPNLDKMCYNKFIEYIVEIEELVELQQKHPNIQQKEFLLKDVDTLIGYGLNHCIIDREKCTIIKIGTQKQVLQAYLGLQKLDENQIQKLYGKDKIIELDIETAKYNTRFSTLNGYFDSFAALLASKLYEYFKLIKQEQIDGQQIFKFIRQTYEKNFGHYDQNKVYDFKSFGKFFPEFCQNQSLYLHKQDSFKKILQALKQEQKQKIFLVTNSHYEFLNFNMVYSYGEDWKDLFDFIVVYAQKPSFFNNTENAIHLLDLNKDTMKSENQIQIQEIKQYIDIGEKIFVGSNYTVAEHYIQQSLNKQNCTIAYFGDGYFSDCFYTEKINNWRCYYISEEIIHENQQKSDLIYDYQRFWGSYFRDQQSGENTFYIDYIRNHIKGGVIGRLDSDFMIDKFWKYDQTNQTQENE